MRKANSHETFSTFLSFKKRYHESAYDVENIKHLAPRAERRDSFTITLKYFLLLISYLFSLAKGFKLEKSSSHAPQKPK